MVIINVNSEAVFYLFVEEFLDSLGDCMQKSPILAVYFFSSSKASVKSSYGVIVFA